MLDTTTKQELVFCELVEHPGGSDGGEFPQYHTYGVADDGSVYYATDFPESSTDTFCDEDPDAYTDVQDLDEAKSELARQLGWLREALANAEAVYSAFERATDLTTHFGED